MFHLKLLILKIKLQNVAKAVEENFFLRIFNLMKKFVKNYFRANLKFIKVNCIVGKTIFMKYKQYQKIQNNIKI